MRAFYGRSSKSAREKMVDREGALRRPRRVPAAQGEIASQAGVAEFRPLCAGGAAAAQRPYRACSGV